MLNEKDLILKKYHFLLDKQVFLIKRMEIIVAILNLYEQAYYKGIPVVSDLKYDSQFNILQELENDIAVNWRKIKTIKETLKIIIC